MKIKPNKIIATVCFCLFSGAVWAVAPPVTPSKKAPDNAASETSAAAETATDTAIKTKVLENPEQSIASGEKRFNQSCVYCHGNLGSGGKAKKLQGRNFDPDYLFKTITKGKRRGSLVMPPWEKTFSDEERWELVSFILSLSAPGNAR